MRQESYWEYWTTSKALKLYINGQDKMAVKFNNNKNHFMDSGINRNTGEYFTYARRCGSIVCGMFDHRMDAVYRQRSALRFALRQRKYTGMLTISKVELSAFDDIFKMLNKMWEDTQFLMVIEPHAQGLYHAHIAVASDVYHFSQEDADYFRTYLMGQTKKADLLTRWSGLFYADRPGFAVAEYLYKNAAAPNSPEYVRHLSINNSEDKKNLTLYRRMTRGFFPGGLQACWRAEKTRSIAFNEALALNYIQGDIGFLSELTEDCITAADLEMKVRQYVISQDEARLPGFDDLLNDEMLLDEQFIEVDDEEYDEDDRRILDSIIEDERTLTRQEAVQAVLGLVRRVGVKLYRPFITGPQKGLQQKLYNIYYINYNSIMHPPRCPAVI